MPKVFSPPTAASIPVISSSGVKEPMFAFNAVVIERNNVDHGVNFCDS